MSSWLDDHALWVAVPLVAILLIVVSDIVARPGISTRAKWLWGILCTVFWPLMLVYWVTRPVHGRGERVGERDDAHGRLVEAALDHEAGRIDDEEMARIVASLRRT